MKMLVGVDRLLLYIFLCLFHYIFILYLFHYISSIHQIFVFVTFQLAAEGFTLPLALIKQL